MFGNDDLEILTPIIFDIETNGFDGDIIWVFSYIDLKDSDREIKSIINKDEIRSFLLKNKNRTLAGHFIVGFDIPKLEDVLGIKINNPLIDTLPLSQYLWDIKRNEHGLESWGVTFNVPKPKIIDWMDPSLVNEYVYRCQEDVRINYLLYKKIINFLYVLYNKDKSKIKRVISYLKWKLDCIREQKNNPIPLDLKSINKNILEIEDAISGITASLIKEMPKNIKYRKYTMPKVMRKKNGSLSSHGRRWLDYLNENNLPVSTKETKKVIKIEPGNPFSSKQMKDWLFQLGWEPLSFKLNDKGEKVPQIKVNRKLCISLDRIVDENPALKKYETLTTLKARLDNLKGFLKNSKDGFIQADAFGITNTFRFKHRNIVNLPGVDLILGKAVRSALIAPQGYLFVGSDMKSLETRTKLHYIYPLDKNYVETVLNDDDYDPHLEIAEMAGLMSKKDVNWYKAVKRGSEEKEPERFKELSILRHIAKQGNYASTYGVGAAKLALAIQKPVSVARKVIQAFKSKNWAIYKVADNFKKKKVNDQLFVFNPVSNFWMVLRKEKDAFSVINQSTGVYCFDLFVNEVRKDYKISLQQHDEIGFFIKEDDEEVDKILNSSINKVNEIVNLNVELDISIDKGNTYADIH